MSTLADLRKTELAKIHIAKLQLKLCDEDYRAILQRVSGKDSAADLNARERQKVLNELYRLGWRATNHRAPLQPQTQTVSPAWDKERLILKIGALLCDSQPPKLWAYADGIARKMFGLESVRFCDPKQLRSIVAALSYDQKRRKRKDRNPPKGAA